MDATTVSPTLRLDATDLAALRDVLDRADHTIIDDDPHGYDHAVDAVARAYHSSFFAGGQPVDVELTPGQAALCATITAASAHQYAATVLADILINHSAARPDRTTCDRTG